VKINISNISDKDRESIYWAVKIIEDVVQKNNGTYFSSYINDLRNKSIINLTLTNSKNNENEQSNDI
jgi:hypothetical protein